MSCTSAPEEPDDPSKRRKPFRSSFFSWIASDESQLERAERLLLKPIEGHFVQFTAAGINTIRSPSIDPSKPTVLLVHGFAGGLGCWVQNWIPLCQVANVYAIDLPGMGRSVREEKALETTCDAVSYYTSVFDEWMKEVKISDPITMAGHSFGGYLSAHYAARRADRVNQLVLCDPWGVALMPPDINDRLSFKFRCMLKLFYTMSPLAILRAAGPWGSKLLPKARPDFADRWSGVLDDPKIFFDYLYHCNVKTPATGELAFRACAQGPGFAKQPLVEFLPKHLPCNVDVAVVHGQHTWMDVGAYRAMVEQLQATRETEVGLHTIQDAGHQLNTDNASQFNDVITRLVRSSSSSSNSNRDFPKKKQEAL